MSGRSEQHASFVIERHLPATPEQVFAAWSDPAVKASWSSCHTDTMVVEYGLDFRVGGSEHNRARKDGADVFVYEARFLDIVDNVRIVYAYDMRFGAARVSASLVTVSFSPAPGGTRMLYTEQAVLLDGHEASLEQRRIGTEEGFDRLEAAATGRPIVWTETWRDAGG